MFTKCLKLRLFVHSLIGVVGWIILLFISGCSSDLGDAAERGDLNEVKWLVKDGADLSHVNKKGQSVLWRAVKGGELEIVTFLINNGADPLQQDKNIGSPLHLAAAKGQNDIVTFFLTQGINVDLMSKPMSETPLWQAVRWEQPKVVRILLEYGADPTIQGRYSSSVLHMATGVHGEKGQQIINLLVNANIDVNIRDKQKRTPLHQAVVSLFGVGNIPLLLKLGADTNAKDNNGETPLDLAIKIENEDAISLLTKGEQK